MIDEKKLVEDLNSLNAINEHESHLIDKVFDIVNNKEDTIDLPKSNVLSYYLSDGSKLIVRPSGTEPKIKAYITAYGTSREDSEKKSKEFADAVSELLGV